MEQPTAAPMTFFGKLKQHLGWKTKPIPNDVSAACIKVLSIPELLGEIISHLSFHDMMLRARLVNHYWQDIVDHDPQCRWETFRSPGTLSYKSVSTKHNQSPARNTYDFFFPFFGYPTCMQAPDFASSWCSFFFYVSGPGKLEFGEKAVLGADKSNLAFSPEVLHLDTASQHLDKHPAKWKDFYVSRPPTKQILMHFYYRTPKSLVARLKVESDTGVTVYDLLEAIQTSDYLQTIDQPKRLFFDIRPAQSTYEDGAAQVRVIIK